MRIRNRNLLSPIIILSTWLLFTLFFFITGPYQYKLNNTFYFYSFLFCIHLALLGGYVRGLQSNGRDTNIGFKSINWLKNSILIFFLYLLFKTFLSGGINILNITNAINNPGESYLTSHSEENISMFNYIDMLFAPLQTIAITGGIYFWKQLKAVHKIVVILIVIITIGNSIAASVRSAMVAIILLIISTILLKIITKKLIINIKTKLGIAFSLVLIIVLFFSYTSHLVKTRNAIVIQNPLTFEDPDPENIYYKLLPDDWNLTITATNFYLGHSYYRLNQAMNMPFNGIGLGFSNSYFVIKNVKKITGWNGLENISYGVRLDKNTAYGIFGVYWSTIYTWMASDFTFPGTIVWVFFIGYFFALCIKDVIKSDNILAIAVFGNFFFLIYSFASVNPFQDGTGITNIGGVFLIWIFYRHKTAVKIIKNTQSL
jgi:hypothetical protein